VTAAASPASAQAVPILVLTEAAAVALAVKQVALAVLLEWVAMSKQESKAAFLRAAILIPS